MLTIVKQKGAPQTNALCIRNVCKTGGGREWGERAGGERRRKRRRTTEIETEIQRDMRTDKQSNYHFSVSRRRSISRVPTAGGWESMDRCASFGAFHQRKTGSDRPILPCACTGAGLRERGREKGGGRGEEETEECSTQKSSLEASS